MYDDNPATGYLNGDNNFATLPKKVLRKPNAKSISDANSSFGENVSASPYMNPEKEYMLKCITKSGVEESEVGKPKKIQNNFTNGEENLRNYSSQSKGMAKKVAKNGKLEPIFSSSNGT